MTSERPTPSAVWGTSFDATAISGVVVEFLKLASAFHRRGYRVHLDLGYDIKEDKGKFFKPYGDEVALFPRWVQLDRLEGLDHVPGYGPEFIRQVLQDVIQENSPERMRGQIMAASGEIAKLIARKWEELNVAFVVVENGTLPENIVYTKALYAAIEEYGRYRGFGQYVLWRDHDLMWSSEPSIKKYGEFPYQGTVMPFSSPFIRYITLHDKARREILEWVHELTDIEVLPNTFPYAPVTARERHPEFRPYLGIPEDALIIVRYTRIILQKRIDREIRLLAAVNAELTDRGIARRAYLLIAGDISESPAEHASLVRLAADVGMSAHVVFTGGLAPMCGPTSERQGWSVRDLLAHADIASFLTSYDYESYGNPIGEAIAARVPYISTRYQEYDTVYGNKGFRAPIMEVSPADNESLTHEFVSSVTDLLINSELRQEVAEFNYRLGQSSSAAESADKLVSQLCSNAAAPVTMPHVPGYVAPMLPGVRASVILPVFNEADSITAVLHSLYDQFDDCGPLDHDTYEIILVDNNSTDATVDLAAQFVAEHTDLAIHLIQEPEQGVACARKAGMDLAVQRSHARDCQYGLKIPFFLVSADADCMVDQQWLAELLRTMTSSRAAIGVCDYYYSPEDFTGRPRLWEVILRTLRCRQAAWSVFGGFPDGKGFAVDRDKYEKVGGIEISYQLKSGRFLNHLSDDWDFGIKVRASGEDITYVPASRVRINPRRVDHAIDEVIAGTAYGIGGTITMRSIRPMPGVPAQPRDLTSAESRRAWEFSVKDFMPKNMILPLVLTPSFAMDKAVGEFLTPSLAQQITRRAADIKAEMSLRDYLPIHSYKSPCCRLYFEFTDELFACLRAAVGHDVGYPPPLPACLADVPPARLREFIRYYCEDRESGEAHNYFGNGGVFL